MLAGACMYVLVQLRTQVTQMIANEIETDRDFVPETGIDVGSLVSNQADQNQL